MSFSLLPEFFAFLGVDIFVALSLLTCLLDEHFPKTLPYVFQAAAIGGYVHILISRDLLTVFGDYMRFWYCFLYLAVALGNVVALDVYLAVIKKQWTLAKVFSGTVVFPAIMVSGFFVSNYASQAIELYMLQAAMLFGAVTIGLSVSILCGSGFIRKHLTRR